jgi:hypothetical protein
MGLVVYVCRGRGRRRRTYLAIKASDNSSKQTVLDLSVFPVDWHLVLLP